MLPLIIVADQCTSAVKKNPSSVSATSRDALLSEGKFIVDWFISTVENIPARMSANNPPGSVTVSIAEIGEMLEDNKAMFACLDRCNRSLDQIESAAIYDLETSYGLEIVRGLRLRGGVILWVNHASRNFRFSLHVRR